MVALWGILFGIIIKNANSLVSYSKYVENNGFDVKEIVLSLFVLVSGGISMWFIYKTLQGEKYRFFNFKDKENNYKCAVEDKELFWVMLLESMTNVWEKNETILEKKSDNFDGALRATIVFAIAVFIVCLI